MRKLTPTLLIALFLLAGVVACGGAEEEAEAPEQVETTAPEMEIEIEDDAPTVAIANLETREGMSVDGTVTFTESDGSVKIVAEVSGVPSAGEHGFHIHETGDCSAPDFTSAGGHFDPTGAPHGAPTDDVHHAGDLGNIEIAADGTGRLERSSEMITLGDGPSSVLGKAVILHEKADDLVSQPTGDAGGRIACAVIELESMDQTVSVDVPGDPDPDGY